MVSHFPPLDVREILILNFPVLHFQRTRHAGDTIVRGASFITTPLSSVFHHPAILSYSFCIPLLGHVAEMKLYNVFDQLLLST